MEGMNVTMKIPKSFKLLCIISILFSIFAFSSLGIAAETFEVDTTFMYEMDGTTVQEGSLKYAIENTSADVITFNLPGNSTITLDEQLYVNRDVKIEGPGPELLTISGQDSYRIFFIQGDATSVDISGISFENGNSSNGGAIYLDADNLTIDNCYFISNSGIVNNNGYGGAIMQNSGNMTISNSLFENNEATGGGAIYTSRNLTIDNCEFISNSTTNFQGGAVYSKGNYSYDYNARLSVSNSTFEQNYSITNGGAIYYHANDLEITNCNFTDNGKNSSDEKITDLGGAVYLERYAYWRTNYLSYNVSDCSFSNNAASDAGGSMYIYNTLDDVPVVVENCAFTNNESTIQGGALFADSVGSLDINNSIFEDNRVPGTADKWGGAIYSENSNVNIKNSTLYDNTASDGGCIYLNSGIMAILNSTIISNDAENHAGGIYNNGTSTLSLSNTTISLNDMDGSCHGSGIYTTGDLSLKNTIIAGNSSKDIGTNDSSGNNINSYGYNLIGFSYYAGGNPSEIDPWDDTDIIIPDITSADIFVAEGLDENGGPSVGSTISGDQYPLLTLALKEDSPAIDAGSSTDIDGNIVSTDQRGATRPQGFGYDIGSFETEVQTFSITAFSPYGGTIDPTSADVVEGGEIEFTITSYPGYILSDLVIDESTSVSADVENEKYTLTDVTASHDLEATFEIDPAMLQEAQTGSFGITGTTGTTNHPPAADDPVGITEEEIISLSVEPVSSNDIGTDLSETVFTTGVSFEIGFESPDEGTGVAQVDLELILTSTDLGIDTFDAISQGQDLETAFFENVSLYKFLDGQAYDLFNLAADYIGMDDVYDFFSVTEAEDAYKVAMTIVIADIAAPQGTEPVLALNNGQELIFFVYDGNQDGKFADPVVALRKSALDPVDPDEPNLQGGSCSIGAFTPLAGLLVLPMLFMFKK